MFTIISNRTIIGKEPTSAAAIYRAKSLAQMKRQTVIIINNKREIVGTFFTV